MRILIAGGVFRLSQEDRERRQPAPEILLVDGLKGRGIDAVPCPLEDLQKVAWDRSFDVVHVHHLSKAALAASLSPLRRPMAFTEHGIPSDPTPLMQVARRLIYLRASGVVCLSEAERAAKVKEFHLGDGKSWVIPNPTKLAQAKPLKRPPMPQPLRLLYVGQLIPLKQVDRIIRALPALPEDVTLRLVYHNADLLSELTKLADELNVTRRVDFVGQLSGTALAREYAEANALVLPSAHEALPSVVSEALLTGLPVIASDVGGIPEQVQGAGILVSPDASVSLDDPIRQLRVEYAQYSQAAYVRSLEVSATLSLSSSIDRHLAFYREMLSTRDSGGNAEVECGA